jgi:hypothetical protein
MTVHPIRVEIIALDLDLRRDRALLESYLENGWSVAGVASPHWVLTKRMPWWRRVWIRTINRGKAATARAIRTS